MGYEGTDNQPLLIRRATPADTQAVIDSINIICDESGVFYTTRFIFTPQWEAVLYHPERVSDHMLVVAEWNGKIIGAGRIFPGGEHTLMNHVAELGLFISRPFRHQGIGTKLLAWLMDWTAQGNIEKITLTVLATNEPAIQFFRKHDFIQVGRMSRQIKTSEHYVDLLLMERFLP